MVDLIPPDFSQCQAYPNVARHTPFSLGPMPTPIRCKARPVWLAVETKPGKDGLHGSMTLCQPCAEIMLESKQMRERVQLQPILREPPALDHTSGSAERADHTRRAIAADQIARKGQTP
jgi:hypothetical protein